VERTDAAKVAGTGIGLSVVQELVAKQHGTVEFVDSARGATLRIRLPRIAAVVA
jgi:signal transduction histidine kinase